MFLLSFNAVNLQFSPDYNELRREAREADRTRQLPQVAVKRRLVKVVVLFLRGSAWINQSPNQ